MIRMRQLHHTLGFVALPRYPTCRPQKHLGSAGVSSPFSEIQPGHMEGLVQNLGLLGQVAVAREDHPRVFSQVWRNLVGGGLYSSGAVYIS